MTPRDPKGERLAAILAAMEKQRQAAKRLDEASEHAAKVSWGLTRGTTVDAIREAEAAVDTAHNDYKAASLELAELLIDERGLPPAVPLNLAVI